MTLSLRSRFLTGVILGTAILLSLFSMILYTIMRHALLTQFDRSLLNTARLLSAAIEDEGAPENQNQQGHQDEEDNLSGHQIEFEFDVRMIPEFNTLNGGAYYQFQNDDGTVLVRSPSLGNSDLTLFQSFSEVPQIQTCQLPGGKQGRAVGYQFIPKGKGKLPLSITIARDAGHLYNQLHFLRWLLLTASATVIGVSLLIALLITRTGLKPIRRLAGEIKTLDAENLGTSHLPQQYPVELLPVVNCLNDLFQRLQAAINRERQFNADVTHELRTPLGGSRRPLKFASASRDSRENTRRFCRIACRSPKACVV
ncbi:MAG TPA: hypothetical protein PK525_12295 [Anaerohalosphaeraceae bacterium]|nr:hypothetical protein [Anaerohalosphaeraceae bacterium]HRT24643.1 hypothetical protein [Anaerohalosphaeraceae bacterium]